MRSACGCGCDFLFGLTCACDATTVAKVFIRYSHTLVLQRILQCRSLRGARDRGRFTARVRTACTIGTIYQNNGNGDRRAVVAIHNATRYHSPHSCGSTFDDALCEARIVDLVDQTYMIGSV